jgi:rhodanese-related sulfurtransferase
MAQPIERTDLRRLIDDNSVQVVDVLPAAEYQWSHIPGAISIPLKTLTEDAARVLDRAKPVAVY